MMRLLPQSLFGRLLLFLAGGLIIAQLLSAAILLQDREQALSHAIGGHIAQRIGAIVGLLDTQEPAERQRLVTALDLPPTRLSLDLPWAEQTDTDDRYQTALFRSLLRRQLGANRPFQVEIADDWPPPIATRPAWRSPPRPPRAWTGQEDQPPRAWEDERPPPPPRTAGGPPRHWQHAMMMGLRNFVVQVRLNDGAVITFQQILPEEVIAWPMRLLLTLLVLLVSVAVLAALAVRALTRPLTVLANAAAELGRDIRRPPLLESGPLEVRRAAMAFNTMQERLIRYIEDRDRILAAVSHDLKTPITRLRLRTEMLDDSPSRDKFLADLDDMQRMVQASLDFLRGGEDSEPMAPVDLNALLDCLREDAEDAGQVVEVDGVAAQPLRCRPLALKRCLTNLVDNALKYGQRADIQVRDTPQRLTLSIHDRGPGIPAEELNKVFEPFYRLERSRNQDTGGVGLGLSIARNIARAHGGDLRLRNHPQGGLEAILDLPR
ncbi:MAG: HAMP domain-containing protein [Phycisphaerales bacterium]|nr:HAMP domain-containing protein [Phycisphaerales bacterium]